VKRVSFVVFLLAPHSLVRRIWGNTWQAESYLHSLRRKTDGTELLCLGWSGHGILFLQLFNPFYYTEEFVLPSFRGPLVFCFLRIHYYYFSTFGHTTPFWQIFIFSSASANSTFLGVLWDVDVLVSLYKSSAFSSASSPLSFAEGCVDIALGLAHGATLSSPFFFPLNGGFSSIL